MRQLEREELVNEITPLIESRIEKRMKIIIIEVLKEILQLDIYTTMKLSEASFKKLWGSEEDAIWDSY